MIKLNKNTKIIVKKKKKIPLSKKIKAEKVISGMVVNGGNMAKAIVAAGYSPNTALTPSKVTNTEAFKEASLSVLEKLKKIQEDQIEEIMSRGLDPLAVKYKELVDCAEKTTKLIELLEGRATERPDNLLNNNQLDELFTRRDKTTLPTREV